MSTILVKKDFGLRNNAQKAPLEIKKQGSMQIAPSEVVSATIPKFDYKKIAVAAGIGLAGFAAVKVFRPDNNILAIAGLAIGGVVGYFGYDVIFPKQNNFANATGRDCMKCCRDCNGKCSCSHNMCTCKGETILMNY